MQPSAWDFQNRLIAILNAARHSGKPYIDVESGHLYTQVEEHPDLNGRMPVCCQVMRQMMRTGDSIVNEPSGGEDATLRIRYHV
jgi:5-methylcytosine-specific restriction protein A